MNPAVQARIHDIIRASGIKPERALEVGGTTGARSLLRTNALADCERYCLNLVRLASDEDITAVRGNANHMRCFADGTFDLVMSNAMLEHDRYFWRSIAEMKRVLVPGGLLILGAPGFVRDVANDRGASTSTFRVHYRFDYYRFSEQAFREVLFEGMERITVTPMLQPPRLVGFGWKPAVPVEARPAASTRVLARGRRLVGRALRGHASESHRGRQPAPGDSGGSVAGL